jgi:predicted transcriptional regulator
MMTEESTAQKVDPSLVAQIVESYVAKNMIAVDELASLITTVHQALSSWALRHRWRRQR